MKRFPAVVIVAAFGIFSQPQAFAQHASPHVMMSPAELT
jgi:hypothetical protein